MDLHDDLGPQLMGIEVMTRILVEKLGEKGIEEEKDALVQEAIDTVNARLARVENIRKFLLLTKELDHDDHEMTATMKVRRATIYKKFDREIEMTYS